jgi:nucleoside-diphosphate-sugar epimerase
MTSWIMPLQLNSAIKFFFILFSTQSIAAKITPPSVPGNPQPRKYNSMILVTGASGFLGAYFLRALLERGQPVRALYRKSNRVSRTLELLKRMGSPTEDMDRLIHWFECDILDIARLEEAFDSITGVIHCAGFVSFDPSDRNELMKVNVEGTANMVHLSLKYPIDYFCHISSVAALGQATPPDLIDEETPWNPDQSNCYGWSKREGEREVWKGIQEGLRAVIVNPGVIMGPGPWNSGTPLIYRRVSKGFRRFPPSNVGLIDATEVPRLCLELIDSESFGESFVLVQEEWDYRELLETVQEIVGADKKLKPVSLRTLKWLGAMESIRAFFSGRSVRLSRDLIRTFECTEHYDNTKVLKTLEYEYPDLRKQLKENGRRYYNTS